MNQDISKWLKANERIDDLQLNGLKIIQNPKGFCFGIDAVLLSDFAKMGKGEKLVEFGTGTGIIPILLSAKSTFKHLVAFEVQAEVADMAKRSVALNGLENRIEVVVDNLVHATRYIEAGTVDAVVTNPPYMSGNMGLKNSSDQKTISRHEIMCTLEDIVKTASKLLKFRGKFYMIHRPNRLVDIICLCRQYNMEPKAIRMIQPFEDKEPNIFLIECVKGGKPEMKVQPPLIVYKEKGVFSDEIYKIYSMVQMTSFTNPKKEADSNDSNSR